MTSIKKHIVLVGMPGSGKSSLGKLLSKRLNLNFVDIDDEIIRQVQMSISEYWNIYKEAAFRSLERECLFKALRGSGSIIATGGGCVSFMDNMSFIEQEIGVYLKCSLAVLEERLKLAERPIFSQSIESVSDQLLFLYKNRSEYYERSSITIDSGLEMKVILNNLCDHSFILTNLQD